MKKVKVNEDELETEIKVNDFVSIALNEEKFAFDGEVAVDFNDTIITPGEANEIVQEFFITLMRYIQRKPKLS